MNRIYKVVFNKTIGAYTAVSELASFKGKKSVKAAVAVGLAGLMMAGAVSAAGLSGGKDGTPNTTITDASYTGTVDGSSGAYAASNGEVKADSVTVNKDLYGGYDYAASGSESRAMASNNNTVTVTNGSDLGRKKNVRGGTVSAANDVTVTSVTASGNGITVKEDSVANGGVLQGASVSGGKEVTGKLTVEENAVSVTGKSAADTKFDIVKGADVSAESVGGDVSASRNKVTVSNAKIGSSGRVEAVAGVRLAVPSTVSEGVNLKADKNEVGLTNVALAGFAEVYGTHIAPFGTAKDVSLSENKVTLSNVTTTQVLVSGVNAQFRNGAKGTLNANGNEVSVTGKSAADTKFDVVEGAYVSAESVGGDVSVSGNKANVSQATIIWSFEGVSLYVTSTTSEGVNLKADKNEVSLTDAKLGSNVKTVTAVDIADFGTAKDVSLSENKVTLDNVTSTNGSVYGGYVSLSDGVKGTLDANGNEVSVTGKSAADTKFDTVQGAYVSAESVGGDVSVSGNKATVTGKSAADTKFDTVQGAYVFAESVGGDVSVSGNKTNVSQATISSAFEGVRLAVNSTTSEGVNLKADKNEAGLTDVALAGVVNVYGADIESFGTAKDVSLSENKVTLSNVTSIEGSVYGGYVSLSDGVKGTLDANGNEATVTGKSAADTKFDTVKGAYVFAESVGGDVSASGNKAGVSKAAIGNDWVMNEVQGVYLAVNSTTSEGVNLKADKNEVGLTDVELASVGVDVYGANIASFGTAKDVSLSENKVTLSNVTSTKRSVYGGYASLRDGVKGTLDANGNEVSVTGKSAADTKFDTVQGTYVSAKSVGGDVSASGNKAGVSKAAIGNDRVKNEVQGVYLDVWSTTSEGVNLKAEKNEVGLTDVELASGGVDVYGADIASFGTAKDVSLSENKVTLSNVTSTEGSVYGGYVSLSDGVKGKLDANGNEVSVTGKSAADAKFDAVQGAYVSAVSVGGDVSASGNKVGVSKAAIGNDRVKNEVQGVYLAVTSTTSEGVNLKADKNEVGLTDVELASGGVDVYGADIADFRTAKDVSLSENKIILDNVTSAQGGVYGVRAVFGNGVKGTLGVNGNEVSVTGKSAADTKFDTVKGAYVYAVSVGGDVSASGNKANVSHATIDNNQVINEVQGVRLDVRSTTSEGVNLKADKNEVGLTDVELASGEVDVYGADIKSFGTAKDVSLSENKVTLDNVTLTQSSVLGGYALLRNGVKGTLDANGNEVSVTGKSPADTKFDSVEGAYVDAKSVGGDVSVSGNKANVSQATISSAFEVVYLSVYSTTSEGVNLKADKNEAGLTDVELASGVVDVYGANIADFGTAKDVSLSENKIILDDVTSARGVYGVRAVFGNGVKGTLDANGNEVSVTGKSAADTKFDSVEGAYVYAYSIGGDVSVSGNKVTVSKATVGGDSLETVAAAEISVETTTSDGVNLKADGNEASLTDAKLGSNVKTVTAVNIKKFGTVNNVSLSENQVTLSNIAFDEGTVYGVSTKPLATINGTIDANKNAVSVTGKSTTATVLRNVYAADVQASDVKGNVTVGGNTVTVTKAKIDSDNSDDRFAGASLKLGVASGSNVAVTANGNTFTLKDAESADADIYGVNLESLSGQVTGVSFNENKVTLDKSKAAGGNIYGAYVDAASATANGSFDLKNNEVTVTGISKTDTVLEDAYGVSADVKMAAGSVTASENKVNLTDAELSGDGDGYGVAAKVSVSATGDGEVNVISEKNTLTAKGADSTSDFTGAYVGLTGDKKINRVTMDGNTATVENGELWGNVTGADFYIGENSGDKVTVGSAEVKNNQATVKGVTATNIMGADVDSDNVTLSDNTADVSETSSVAYAVGAEATGDGNTLTGNTAKVISSTVQGGDGVYGAKADGDGAVVSGNTATVSNSQVLSHTVSGNEIGGYVQGAEVIGNNAKISGNSATVKTDSTVEYVSGAFANGDGNELTNNVANVSDSTVKGASDEPVFRDRGIVDGVIGAEAVGNNAVLSGNTVNVSNSDVSDANISGAEAIGDGAKLTGNTANVTDTQVKFANGADVFGNNATASGNTVNVGGDSVVGVGVWGAFAEGKNNVLSKNTVNLSGNTEFKDGAVVFAADGYTNESTNTVKDNTVNVTDSVKLSNVDMYGRRKDNQGSGNTLNLNNWQGKIKSVNYFDNVNVKTSSAEPEQVVIGDLVKGNADTRINIGLDGKASRELEEKTSTAEEAAIGASKVVKLEDVDGSAEHNEKFDVKIAEGDVSGEITAEVWEDGSVDNLVVKALHEKENSVMKSLTNIAANNFLVFRQQMNDLNKRMGDLRTMPQSDGVWGRAVAGQAEYKQMHSTYKTLQVGADKRIGQFLVGATASYTDADGSLKNGSSDDKNYTYGIYGSWLGDNGHYVDVIVKRHHVQSDYDLRYTDGRKTDGMMHTSGTSISAEYGKRFAITNTNFYVEPQVEVMWGHLDSDSYKLSNGVQIKQDGIDSLIGRLGVAAGWVSPDKKGSAYIKASVLNDWEAESDVTARKGATVRKYTEDMGGTWGEFAIGGTYNFGKNFSAYGEVETTAGNPTRTTYQASAGIRYSF